MNRFKYKTAFSSSILACSSLESEEWNPWNISNASLESLKDVMPQGIDLDKNIDLLGVAFNAAVVNAFNKNGDGIDSETAIQIKDYFINKPTNIEHERKKVVGHIVGSSFSDFQTNRLLSDEDVAELNSPFNIALASVVYRTVNPQFANVLESALEDGFEKSISASWELGFNEYAIALGSNNLKDAEIITDPAMVGEFEKYLKTEGGTGEMDDGTQVNRLVLGEVYPLGIGFTTNPAAAVEGVHVVKPTEIKLSPSSAKEKKSTKNISQSNNSTVKTPKLITMEQENLIQQLEEILDDKLSKKEYASETVANIAGIITEAIREKSDHYVQEKKELEEEKERLAKAEEEFKASTEELQEKLQATEAKIEALEIEKQEREAKTLFNSRMAEIDEQYELDDADRKIVASEVGQIDSAEESFVALQDKFAVVWKTKTKAFIEQSNAEMQAKIDEEVQKRIDSLSEVKASEPSEQNESTEDVLENVEVESVEVATNNNAEASRKEETLAEKFRSVFTRENVNIKY